VVGGFHGWVGYYAKLVAGRTILLPRRAPRQISTPERALGFVLLALLAALTGLFLLAGARPGPAGLPAPAATAPAAALPLKSPGGWGRGAIESYGPETLFEKINGKADAYLVFDVAGLEFAGYARPEDPDSYVDVYLYDMAEPLNAFGIYRAQRSGTEKRLDAPDEGCAVGASAFARRGRYYLEVLASGADCAAEARALAAAVAAALPAPAAAVEDPPWFPREGLRIVRYEPETSFGLANAFVAIYEDGTQVVVAPGGEAELRAARETLEFLGTACVFAVSADEVVGIVGSADKARLERLLEVER
jgi:hypothetical protein